jgi:hypothetical protein
MQRSQLHLSGEKESFSIFGLSGFCSLSCWPNAPANSVFSAFQCKCKNEILTMQYNKASSSFHLYLYHHHTKQGKLFPTSFFDLEEICEEEERHMLIVLPITNTFFPSMIKMPAGNFRIYNTTFEPQLLACFKQFILKNTVLATIKLITKPTLRSFLRRKTFLPVNSYSLGKIEDEAIWAIRRGGIYEQLHFHDSGFQINCVLRKNEKCRCGEKQTSEQTRFSTPFFFEEKALLGVKLLFCETCNKTHFFLLELYELPRERFNPRLKPPLLSFFYTSIQITAFKRISANLIAAVSPTYSNLKFNTCCNQSIGPDPPHTRIGAVFIINLIYQEVVNKVELGFNYLVRQPSLWQTVKDFPANDIRKQFLERNIIRNETCKYFLSFPYFV